MSKYQFIFYALCAQKFERRNVKLCGVSCENIGVMEKWITDIKTYYQLDTFNINLLADEDRNVAFLWVDFNLKLKIALLLYFVKISNIFDILNSIFIWIIFQIWIDRLVISKPRKWTPIPMPRHVYRWPSQDSTDDVFPSLVNGKKYKGNSKNNRQPSIDAKVWAQGMRTIEQIFQERYTIIKPFYLI